MDDRKTPAFAYVYWAAALAIVALRAAHVIDVPWWAATAPFWGPLVAMPVSALLYAIIWHRRR